MDHFAHFGPENKLKRVQITTKMLKTCRNLPKFTFCAMYNILHHAFYAQVHIVYTCSFQNVNKHDEEQKRR